MVDGVLALFDTALHEGESGLVVDEWGGGGFGNEIVHKEGIQTAEHLEAEGVLGDHCFFDLAFDGFVERHGDLMLNMLILDILPYMTTILIIAVILFALLNVVLLVLFMKRGGARNDQETQRLAEEMAAARAAQLERDNIGLKLLLEQMNELTRTVDKKMGETTRHMSDAMHRQFGESQRLIKDITNELVQVKETGKQVVGFADQLQSLQDILKNPKQRGILGEYYLETLLKNVMPPGGYQMQYAFKNGEIVDAAVFVKDKVIPVDSKFSLENYNRLVEERDPVEKDRLEKTFVNDLKLRIQETAKYVRPNEGTMDFAFMFIPHEAIYYDLLINKIGAVGGGGGVSGAGRGTDALGDDDSQNLIQRAASKYKVIIVSPTSFLAYLQTVLQGLKALQIEETAKDIIKRVEELGTHLKKYEEYHGKLGNALGTVVNHYNASGKELKKVDKDVLRITGQSPAIDVPSIEKPEVGE